MEKTIIITNGSGGCGKDTFAKLIQERYTVYKYSSICKIKDISAMCGVGEVVTETKSEKFRKFLSDLKSLLSRHNDMPMDDLRSVYSKFMSDTLGPNENDKYSGLVSDYPSSTFLIIDIREPEEISKAVKEFGAITILITNPYQPKISSNEADANVDDYTYDYHIINSGSIDDFRNKISILLNMHAEGKRGYTI